MYVLLPHFGVAVRGNATLTIACINWLFRTRRTLRCDVTPVLALIRFTKTNVTFVTPFGSTVRGKGNHNIASIGHSELGNPKVRYDTGFSIAFYINICQFCYPFLLPIFGLRSGVKPSLKPNFIEYPAIHTNYS